MKLRVYRKAEALYPTSCHTASVVQEQPVCICSFLVGLFDRSTAFASPAPVSGPHSQKLPTFAAPPVSRSKGLELFAISERRDLGDDDQVHCVSDYVGSVTSFLYAAPEAELHTRHCMLSYLSQIRLGQTPEMGNLSFGGSTLL